MFISGDTAPERIELATKSGHPLLHEPIDADELAAWIIDVLETLPTRARSVAPKSDKSKKD